VGRRGQLTYSGTDGRRDFAGTTRLQAQRYAVEVAGSTDSAETARAVING